MLGGHSVHGIVYLLKGSGAGADVKERELCDSRLVLPVEGHLCGVRGNIPPGVNAEFVAAYGLAVNYAGVI